MNYWEAEDLALYAMGKTEEQIEEIRAKDLDVEELIADEFDVTLDQFANIAENLLLLTPTVTSVIGNKNYHAFVKHDDGCFTAIVKQPVETK